MVLLGTQAEGIVLQEKLNWRRTGGRVQLSLRGTLVAEVLAWFPPVCAKDLVAERAGIAGPFGVVRIVGKFPPTVVEGPLVERK